MSRAAVYSALVNSADLQALGITQPYIQVNFDEDQRPAITIDSTHPIFLVIRWGGQNFDPRMFRGPWIFDIWVHLCMEFSTDPVRIDNVIEILDDVLTSMIDVPGADGRSVTQIDLAGRSRDQQDDAYQTICRSTTYRMISRMTSTGKV